MITEYMNFCIICGKPRTDVHHAIEGGTNGRRALSDEDALLLPLCHEHHLGNMSVHKNHEMNVMSHIIGQLSWEKEQVGKGMPECMAREEFRRRYGKSYL